MVVEFLTFNVPVDERDEWLQIEERHWSRFLERQQGFVRKQIWSDVDDPTVIRAVIWWESMEAWRSIPQADLDAVAAAMGPHERTATCVAYELLRES
jgi:uncharacterized protein (TIGR03792 family)